MVIPRIGLSGLRAEGRIRLGQVIRPFETGLWREQCVLVWIGTFSSSLLATCRMIHNHDKPCTDIVSDVPNVDDLLLFAIHMSGLTVERIFWNPSSPSMCPGW
ncbi:hypothetical protein BDV33DRAFT_182003 [Aspergillus novoparasiticus]|uniref:Uncharacterized protein n=1 Tax=Aspergillus novoparasiticus TaxID=986946 RepID=A0A5N6EB57_9EURO|nr:hypothetical protein BDV33DRAFT_182003 [Aspergillus novoparasiticus]